MVLCNQCNSLDISSKHPFCQAVGFILHVNGVSAVCFTAFLAITRFASLFYAHLLPKYFSCHNKVQMLSCVYPLIFAVAIALVYLNDMLLMGNTICGPEIENMSFVTYISSCHLYSSLTVSAHFMNTKSSTCWKVIKQQPDDSSLVADWLMTKKLFVWYYWSWLFQ